MEKEAFKEAYEINEQITKYKDIIKRLQRVSEKNVEPRILYGDPSKIGDAVLIRHSVEAWRERVNVEIAYLFAKIEVLENKFKGL